ncbi:MAG TPA: hypothetical protein PK042_01930 [Usitatibacteraceae bacterium]|nr:hypothetical protein [Usitatibacteraceae bacterium]
MKPTLFAATALLVLPAPALAGSPEPRIGNRIEHRLVIDGHDVLADAAAAKDSAFAWRQWGDDLRASMGTLFGDHFAAARPVKDAPYSADVSTETHQTLADGNVIAKKTSGRVFRDSAGRTRQETVIDGEAKSIQLRDPVEGSAVMLLPGSKKAVRLPHVSSHAGTRQLQVLRLGEREIRIADGKISVDGKPIRGKVELTAGGKEIRIADGSITIDGKPFAPGDEDGKAIVKQVETVETGDGTRREEVRVHVVRRGEGKDARLDLPPGPALGPLLGRLDGTLLGKKGVTTSLGTKDFEGVKAEGKSTVRTIPAGEIGNRNPILITSESWFSPELQVTVHSRQSDPRHGETVYRLTNIRRGEPAAELFKVPVEYAASGKRDKR